MVRVASIAVVCGLVLMGSGIGCKSTAEEPFKGQDVFWSYPSYVPENAKTIAEGTGRLEATINQAGTAYLVDLDQSVSLRDEPEKQVKVPKVLISGLAQAGQTVVFDPAAGTVGVRNGKPPIKLKNIDPAHRHQIRLAPAEK